MKTANQGSQARQGNRAYTLVELLCSIGIAVLMAAMLMPALNKGYAKAQRIYCVNNLHQTGLAFHSFALAHQDRFPMQVSTNDGGSMEFLQAANAMTGEFYFSYRHFAALSNELGVAKVLNCPTDTRHPATNFAGLQNDNLSYFVAGNPEFGNPNSALAGNRNLSPLYGSIASVGGYRSLMWNEELHRFKGNVLFSDGHVDQLNDMFSITNSGIAAPASLHMPSVKPEPDAVSSGGGGGNDYGGGIRPGGRGPSSSVCTIANQVGSNQMVMTWRVSGGRQKSTLTGFAEGSDVGGGVSLPPDQRPGSPTAAPAPRRAQADSPGADPGSPRGVYQQVVKGGQALLRGAAGIAYEIPWYLLLLVIIALLELRRRIRARQKSMVRQTFVARAG